MGGLPCAKQIIDNRNGLVQAMDCMTASILLNHQTTAPTQEMADEFQEKCNEVAKLSAKIQRYVSVGSY